MKEIVTALLLCLLIALEAPAGAQRTTIDSSAILNAERDFTGWEGRISVRIAPSRGKYNIRTALTNRYLDVYTGNPSAGTPLQIWDKVGRENQVWEIIPSPEPGFVYIKSEMGRYLDVQWSGTAAGTPVHIWAFNGSDAQKWRLSPVGAKHFAIRSKLGTFLDVSRAGTANGTRVWTWPELPGAAQEWIFEPAGGNPLKGFVDMHTHPMSHLGFGGKAMHGAPGADSILPAGTRDCNATDLRATTIEQALGHCNSTHGGWGFDNGCGNTLRAGILNYALDRSFVHRVGFDRNPHGRPRARRLSGFPFLAPPELDPPPADVAGLDQESP